MTILTPVVEHS